MIQGLAHSPVHMQRQSEKANAITGLIHSIFTLAEAGIACYGIVNREYVAIPMVAGVLTFHIAFIYDACVKRKFD